MKKTYKTVKQSEVKALLKAYAAAQEAAKAKDAIGAQLKALADAEGVNEIKEVFTLKEGGTLTLTATIKRDIISTTLDSKRLKAEMPDVWERYKRTSSTTRLYFK